MMFKQLFILFSFLSLPLFSSARQMTVSYRDASLPVDQRVSDLLSCMTLEEKIGQLRCALVWNCYDSIDWIQDGKDQERDMEYKELLQRVYDEIAR